MKSPMLLAAAVVALLLVMVARMLLDDAAGSADADPLLRAGPEAADAAPVAPLGAGEDGTASPLERPTLPPAVSGDATAADDDGGASGARVHGRVTLPGASGPVADLTLRFSWYPRGPDGEEGDRVQADTRSDALGDYELFVPLEGPARLARVESVDGGDVPDQHVTLGLELRPGEDHQRDLELEAGVQLAGQVVDDGGQPLPGALVHGWSGHLHLLRQDQLDQPQRVTAADGAGRFRMGGVGPSWVLSATAPGRTAHERLHGRHASGTRLEGLTLRLSASRSVGGQVLTPDGSPLAGATVRTRAQQATAQDRLTDQPDVYRTGPRPRIVETGGDGRFQLGPLADREYGVTVSHAAYPDWEGRHAPDDGDLLVRMVGGLSLAGVVFDVGGRPLEGARVRLRSLGAASNNGSTTSDDEGRFRFDGLAADDRTRLAVVAAGHAVHVEQPLVLAAGQPELHLRLDAEQRLAGRVVDPAGAPVPDAAVAIEGDRVVDTGGMTIAPIPTWEREFGLDQATTDAQGRFTFVGLYGGTFRIEAGDGDLRAVAQVVAPDEDVTLVLDPAAVVGVTFSGRAFDVTTGLPVTEFDVTPMLPSGNGGMIGNSTHFEDDEGRYRLVGLDAGPILLTAQAAGYAPWSAGLVEHDEGEHRVDIALSPTRSVVLQVQDDTGVALSGVGLTFADEDGDTLMVSSGPGSMNSRLQTDADGRALASGLPAEVITVTVSRGWLSPEQGFLVDLGQPPTGPVPLVVERMDQAVLVFVVTGTPSRPEALSGDGMAVLRALVPDLESGALRRPEGAVVVEALDANGERLGVLPGDTADSEQLPAAWQGTGRVLRLPGRPWTLEARVGDGPPTRRAWTPVNGRGPAYVVLVVPG